MENNTLKISNEFKTLYFLPSYNAKIIATGIEQGNSVLLPNSDGKINASSIYNGNTGYIVSSEQLIPLLQIRSNQDYKSDVVATSSLLSKAGTSKKQNEKGFYFTFKNKTDNQYHTAQYIFPEQTVNPTALIDYTKNSLKANKALVKETYKITSEYDYLPAYIAACKSGIQLEVDKTVAEKFSNLMTKICENQVKKEKDITVKSFSSFIHDADKKSNEIISQIRHEKGYENNKTEHAKEFQHTHQKQKKDIERSF